LSQTGPIPHSPPDKFAAVDANPQNLPLSPQNLPLSRLAPVPQAGVRGMSIHCCVSHPRLFSYKKPQFEADPAPRIGASFIHNCLVESRSLQVFLGQGCWMEEFSREL
jgi:hypothetical protein